MRLSQRGRAQLLRKCLDRMKEGEDLEAVLAAYPGDAKWLRPELEAVEWLGERHSALAPDPGFETSSKDELLARIREKNDDAPSYRAYRFKDLWRRNGRRDIVNVILVTMLAFQLVLNGSGLARASGTWLPGDTLYPLRLLAENAQLFFDFEDASQARLHIEFARRRLLEIQALIFEGRYERIPETVMALEGQVIQAARLVNQLAGEDVEQARQLAKELRQALSSQTGLVLMLARFTPPATSLACERVRTIYQDGASAVKDLLYPGSRELRESF